MAIHLRDFAAKLLVKCNIIGRLSDVPSFEEKYCEKLGIRRHRAR